MQRRKHAESTSRSHNNPAAKRARTRVSPLDAVPPVAVWVPERFIAGGISGKYVLVREFNNQLSTMSRNHKINKHIVKKELFNFLYLGVERFN